MAMRPRAATGSATSRAKLVTTPVRVRWLRGRVISDPEAGNLLEALLLEVQPDLVAGAAEAVLGGLEDSAPLEVLVLLLDAQLDHGVDHVLELLGAGHLAGLVDLADDDRVGVGLLGPAGHQLEDPLRGLGVGQALPLAVVHALEGVDQEEEGLAGALGPQGVALLQEGRDVRLLADREAGLEPEALGHQLDLVEALLGRVEDHHRALLREAVGQLQEHRGLAGAGGAGEEDHLAGGEALAAHGRIDEVDPGLDLVPELVRDLDAEDVGAETNLIAADLELHWGLLGEGPWGPVA